MSCYGWAWVVAANNYGLGMGTNSKENVGLWCSYQVAFHFERNPLPTRPDVEAGPTIPKEFPKPPHLSPHGCTKTKPLLLVMVSTRREDGWWTVVSQFILLNRVFGCNHWTMTRWNLPNIDEKMVESLKMDEVVAALSELPVLWDTNHSVRFRYPPEVNAGHYTKARFTPWTMKSDHGRWPFSMVQLLEKSIYKAFGPLTRCTSNVDQEEWSCIRKVHEFIFLTICPKRVVLEGKKKI